MKSENLNKEVRKLFGMSGTTTGNKPALHLLLVDNMPVTKVMEGKEVYAFVNTADPDTPIYYVRSSRAATRGVTSFTELMKDFPDGYLSRRMCITDQNSVQEDYISKVRRIGVLDAVSIITKDFETLTEIAKTQADSVNWRNQYLNKSDAEYRRLINFYNSYMIYANIWLSEIFSKGVCTKPAISRHLLVCNLQEFIPIMVSIPEIDNPLFRAKKVALNEFTAQEEEVLLWDYLRGSSSAKQMFSGAYEEKFTKREEEHEEGFKAYYVTYMDLGDIAPQWNRRLLYTSKYNRALLTAIYAHSLEMRVTNTYTVVKTEQSAEGRLNITYGNGFTDSDDTFIKSILLTISSEARENGRTADGLFNELQNRLLA